MFNVGKRPSILCFKCVASSAGQKFIASSGQRTETEKDFTSMFIQNLAKINSEYWSDGSFITNDNLKSLESIIDKPPENLSFTSGKNLSASKIIRSIYETKPDFVIIDYDQKMILEGSDEWYLMLKTIEKIEDAAKIINSHIIILAQADDSGDLKSSKRSKQPASAVLNFHKNDEGTTVIKSIKNRFNKSFILELNYSPETSSVYECDFISNNPIQKSTKPRVPKFRFVLGV